jgi:hypothetical protein
MRPYIRFCTRDWVENSLSGNSLALNRRNGRNYATGEFLGPNSGEGPDGLRCAYIFLLVSIRISKL